MIELIEREELKPRAGETRKQYNKRFRRENPFDKNMPINLEDRMLSFNNKKDLIKCYNLIKQAKFKLACPIEEILEPIFNKNLKILFNCTGMEFVSFIDYLIDKDFTFNIHSQYGGIVQKIEIPKSKMLKEPVKKNIAKDKFIDLLKETIKKGNFESNSEFQYIDLDEEVTLSETYRHFERSLELPNMTKFSDGLIDDIWQFNYQNGHLTEIKLSCCDDEYLYTKYYFPTEDKEDKEEKEKTKEEPATNESISELLNKFK